MSSHIETHVGTLHENPSIFSCVIHNEIPHDKSVGLVCKFVPIFHPCGVNNNMMAEVLPNTKRVPKVVGSCCGLGEVVK